MTTTTRWSRIRRFGKTLVRAVLVLLVVVGIAGFHLIEGWTYFDGFYMVLTTITSIGYGEIHPLSHAGRLFNSFIIITGVGLVLLLVQSKSHQLTHRSYRHRII